MSRFPSTYCPGACASPSHRWFCVSVFLCCLCAVAARPPRAADAQQETDYGNYPAPVKKYLGRLYEEGQRKYAFREGEYVDTHVMARVRD